VALGDVTVYDAQGRTLEARMEVAAARTRIIVSAADLMAADYPVTIDPEVGSNDFRISDMGGDGNASYDAHKPSVAYNSTDNEYLVVWWADDHAGSLADGEFEIYGQLIDGATGAEIGADIRISDMSDDGNPTYDAYDSDVAWNATDNVFLVVWRADDNTGSLIDGKFEIYGQRISVAGAEIGGDLRLSDMGAADGSVSFEAEDPSVSYNATDNVYLVVWHGDDDTAPQVDNETEVFFQVVAGATGAEVGPDERISDMGTDGDVASSVFYPDAAWNSTDNEFLVVWSGDEDVAPLVNGENEIFGQRLDGAAVPINVSGYLVD